MLQFYAMKITKNLVLVGFMGTGKSATAKLLAQRLKLVYLSMDEEIEKRQGMKICEIFEKKGEAYFRKLEADLAKELGLKTGLVIDAGGGVVLNPDNIKYLRKNGKIFLLTSSAEKILERTKKEGHRPLLKVADPLAKIKELLKQRKTFYQKAADYIIDCDDITPEGSADKIEEILNSFE